MTSKAIILAAGRGSRMGALTDKRPKGLAELGGRTLLEWQCSALRGAGIGRIAVVRGYSGGEIDLDDVTYFENARWAETNMVATLAYARPWLGAQTCLVSYSDIVYGASAVRALMAAQGDIAITYDPHWRALWEARFDDPLADAETFRIDADDRLIEIGARPTSLDDVQGQYMGLLRFTQAGWSSVEALLSDLPPAERDRLDMTGLLARLIEGGAAVAAIPISGSWGEVDSARDLRLYERRLAEGRLELS